MLYWSIQITIISIILIFLVHHLILFFKTNLTVPKIKDLVNSPTQKYQNMYNIISSGERKSNPNNNPNYIPNYIPNNNTILNPNINPMNDIIENSSTKIDSLVSEEKIEKKLMKNELKNFLKSQMDISSPINNSNTGLSYSSF